ncbi:hypothetical protein ASZ90_014087 [hydrocarbon metagenome]|jgi:hypothetical protein|uniref:Uncharacterized protein n=1 Tax=hydrocarbon metagenome TaxID=938273 RepID=A0A0W8F5X1_9ZZZZ
MIFQTSKDPLGCQTIPGSSIPAIKNRLINNTLAADIPIFKPSLTKFSFQAIMRPEKI